MKKGLSMLLTILSVFIIVGIVGGAYYLGTTSSKSGSPQAPSKISPSQSAPTAQVMENKGSLFSGKIKKLDKDLALFKITDVDKENFVPDSIVYYEAGTYLKGDFAGYTRILAIRPSEGPGPSLQFILATKDYASYILDDPENKTKNYPEDDWDNPYMYLDKSKITQIATLASEHPLAIEVQKPFKLIRRDSVLLETKNTNKKSKGGYDIYIESPISTFDGSPLVVSSQAQLSLFAGGVDWGTAEALPAKEKTALATRNTYLKKTTLVHAVDSTGLTYSYILATATDVDSYIKSSPVREQQNIEYKKQIALYNAKKLSEYPTSPKWAVFPGLRLTKSASGIQGDYYSTYDSAFPGACGGTQSTYVVESLADTDLVSVTSNTEFPLFTLKDPSHPLNKLAYETKTDQGEESFKSVNDNKSMPTLADYVAKHPLIFLKDAWGRWVVMGEYDLKLMGGCGKPVVYLYPEKPTTVHLSFASPVELSTQIPTYHNGWNVLAEPNGTLTDLQPTYTDCSELGSRFGSEYAQEACKSHTYPYIYWSGKSADNSYPNVTGGWIVERQSLPKFLQEKLNEMGLTANESTDMISYWVPKMNEKNAPYYKVGFVQTREMNAFVPMMINPQPDSVLRIFLDWKALANKPTQALNPQHLDKFIRHGFTYVEWGGLHE